MHAASYLWARQFQHALIAALAGVVFCIASQTARADASGDGLYGRFDRDSELIMSMGSTWSKERDFAALSELRFLVANTAGPVVSMRWPKPSNRIFIAGIEARPLFPALFFLDLSTGRPRFDLMIQSLSVELGVASPLDGSRAVAFDAGFGIAFPLLLPHEAMQGVWFRLGGRRIIGRSEFRPSGGQSLTEWSVFAMLDVSIGFRTGIASWAPPSYRAR